MCTNSNTEPASNHMVTTIQANRNNVILIVISVVCTIVAVGTLILITIVITCLCHYGKQTDCIDITMLKYIVCLLFVAGYCSGQIKMFQK